MYAKTNHNRALFYRTFLENSKSLLPELTSVPGSTSSPEELLESWLERLIEEVCASFREQVLALMETVKQMDTALQRRSKLRQNPPGSTSSGIGLSDSEKITLQIILDVAAFGKDIVRCGVEHPQVSLPSYRALQTILIDEVTAAGDVKQELVLATQALRSTGV